MNNKAKVVNTVESKEVNKLVYLHISKESDKVFYVGQGGKYRPRQQHGRTQAWNDEADRGYDIRVVANNLTKAEAMELEALIIESYGIDNLANRGSGLDKPSAKTKLSMANNNCHNKRVIDDSTGIEYRSVSSMCRELGISHSTTSKRLNGQLKNTSSFRYL